LPDSRWLAYTNELPSFLHAVFVYSVADRRSRQITDGLSDARYPAFDAAGKYLYFTSSTNTGLTSQRLDMTSDEHPVSSNVYAAVLQRNAASPVAAQTDDEEVAQSQSPPASGKADGLKHVGVTIDFDGILQRIVALPIPTANYTGLSAGKPGEIYLIAAPLTSVSPEPRPLTVLKFDLKSRMAKPFATGVKAFALSANGEKALVVQGSHWLIAGTDKPLDASVKPLPTQDMQVFVDPPAEWRRMYHETWRIELDFFYDPDYHGLDVAAAERRFEP
jgi:tricorn protease